MRGASALLHPLKRRQCQLGRADVNRLARLTSPKALAYQATRMTNLATIAASSTARLWWWRCAKLAARWRD
jgi:hypothetical protein